jgi:hypothetical protein
VSFHWQIVFLGFIQILFYLFDWKRMAPTKEKRSRARAKKAPSIKTQGKGAVRTGHVVCVSSVPSALCAKEPTVRNYFGVFGELLSVTVHQHAL